MRNRASSARATRGGFLSGIRRRRGSVRARVLKSSGQHFGTVRRGAGHGGGEQQKQRALASRPAYCIGSPSVDRIRFAVASKSARRRRRPKVASEKVTDRPSYLQKWRKYVSESWHAGSVRAGELLTAATAPIAFALPRLRSEARRVQSDGMPWPAFRRAEWLLHSKGSEMCLRGSLGHSVENTGLPTHLSTAAATTALS